MAETKRMTAEQVVSYLLEEDGVDFLRESLRWVVQQLMEVEVCELIGAEHGERSEERLTHRNGYRPRRWDTRAGEIELAIPKLRRGQLLPELSRAAPPLGAGAGCGRAGGVRRRRLDPEGRSSGRVAGAAGLEERGVKDLPGTRRAGGGVPQPPARGPLPLSVAGCEGREGPRWRPRRA